MTQRCSSSATAAGLTGRLDPTLRTTLVELCRLLDGLPLAIELAAARCDVLAPADIVARLGGRPGFLHSDDPTVSARQRSLDATIEWSHQLLRADEQLAFRRLGVFAAGFGLEAPCAAVAADDIDAYDVPELIWSLVSKSLVVNEPAAGSTRYRMLDTVRAFAQRQLTESGELADVALRLARFFLDSYGPQLEKADVQLLAQRSRDIDNVRPLIAIVAPHDEELAQELACMVVVDSRRASPGAGGDEGLRLLDRLPARTPARVALLAEVVVLASDHGLVDRAAALLDETQLLAAEVGTPPWLDGRIDQFRGILALQRGDAHAARAIAEAALERTSSWRGRSRLLNLLSMAAMQEGRPDDSRSAAEGALEISTRLGNTDARVVDLGNLAEIEMLAGDTRAAARRQLECLDVALELGSLTNVTSAWIVAARLAAAISDWTIATRLQGAADAAMERIGLALYPPDRALCDELLAAAPTHLGAASFDSLIAAGRTLSLTEATAQARQVLTIVADAEPPPPADPRRTARPSLGGASTTPREREPESPRPEATARVQRNTSEAPYGSGSTDSPALLKRLRRGDTPSSGVPGKGGPAYSPRISDSRPPSVRCVARVTVTAPERALGADRIRFGHRSAADHRQIGDQSAHDRTAVLRTLTVRVVDRTAPGCVWSAVRPAGSHACGATVWDVGIGWGSAGAQKCPSDSGWETRSTIGLCQPEVDDGDEVPFAVAGWVGQALRDDPAFGFLGELELGHGSGLGVDGDGVVLDPVRRHRSVQVVLGPSAALRQRRV